MADKKISQLDDSALLTGAEFIPIVQPPNNPKGNRKVTVDDLMANAPVQSVNGDIGDVVVTPASIGALQAGDNVSLLTNDLGYLTSESKFVGDVTFVLNAGESFGKYTNGETAPWNGLTAVQALLDAAIDYINPVFNSFSISGQSTTIEVGTTLSGSKTFTWNISANSGVVSTIDLYNITTAATLLAGTPNDGSQAQTITSVQLNSNGATQQWRGVGNNSSPSGTFNSSTFTVTSRYYRWWAPVSSTPANSAAVRALAGQAFQTSGNSFTLVTGTVEIEFSVNLPPTVTIVSVIDTTNLNLDLTAFYVLIGTVNVTDAGGTTRAYNQYKYSIAVPYGTSANHVITTT